MAPRDRDAGVDRLYQLPLDQFTEARNALARELKRPEIKELEKPNISAWAVNQLYWNERSTYDALTDASERLRAEHRKLLTGKPAEIRQTEKLHRDAVRGSVERVKKLLIDAGHAATDATLSAVQETLEALPASDTPGRLTRPLKRLGFEALAGVPVTASTPRREGVPPRAASSLKLVRSAPTQNAPPRAEQKKERDEAKRREKEERERREQQAQAEKDLKAAEAAMLRAEDAVKRAEKTLGELRVKRDEAVSEYQRARLRARG